jgi:hypothetical protein
MRFLVIVSKPARFLFLAAIGFALIGPQWGLAQTASDEPATKADEFSAEQLDFFERQVRPLLIKRCYECHGDVGDELKGGLRMDSRAALLKGGDTGPSIDLSSPEKGLLLDAIRYGETYQMPPKSKLPAEELAVLEKWILDGAPWPKEEPPKANITMQFDLADRKASHWAWRPIAKPTPPAVSLAAWQDSPIDRFILAKLEQNKLAPTPEADRRILIRRLYYDLLGLPPAPEEVANFLSDTSPEAFEKLVDELLKSPQFGERWGRHWLDVVAYAETRGHEFDYDIPGAALYRDYVIRSINNDLPFDQFAMEHIAGDLIERRDDQKRHESALATGFWHLGEWLHSPVDIRKDETDRFDRMIDVYSKSFLGLTVSCARCHDHKFDAISQQDYYALSGFLQSMEYRQYRYETSDLEREAAVELAHASTELQKKLRDYLGNALKPAIENASQYAAAAMEPDASSGIAGLDAGRLAAWRKELEGARLTASAVPAKETTLEANARVIEEFASPERPLLQDGFAFGLRARLAGEVLLSPAGENLITGIRQRGSAVLDPAFSRLATAAKTQRDMGVLGATIRAGKTLRTSTFILKQPTLFYLVKGSGRALAAVDSHRAINGPLHGGLLTAFDAPSKPENAGDWRWIRHDLKDYLGHNLHVEFSPDKDGPFEVAMVVESDQAPPEPKPTHPLWKRVAPAELHRAAQELLSAWMHLVAGAPLSPEAAADLSAIVSRSDLFPLASGPDTTLRAEIENYFNLQSKWTQRLSNPSRLAMASWEGNPVDDHLLIRGNASVPGDPAPRSFLTAIRSETNSATSGATRIDLAKSTVAPGNPLFARVAVNRVWHHLFGKGIVPSVDNFGVLGLPPSHPELLDHLASEFATDGYSLKRLIKRIVLSRTYQQSSQHRAEGDSADPKNLLLHRMNLRRRDAEAIRDGILALSGRLDLKPPHEGESIPVYLTPYMDGRGRPATSGPLDGEGKRSVYLALRRNFLPPFLTVFDFPPPAAPFGARNQSNVPAQALAMLNDPFVHDQAKVWAESLLQSPADFEGRLNQAYQTAFSRAATPEEIQSWREFSTDQSKTLGAASADGEKSPQVWADICHLLMNAKEFLFVQ